MLSRDLIGDATFDALLRRWLADRRCPLVLVDCLLDYGLDGQAEAARWAATAPAVPVEWGLEVGPFTKFGGPTPGHTVPDHKPTLWFWSCRSRHSIGVNGGCVYELPHRLFARVQRFADDRRPRFHKYFTSPSLALCGLLDGYAAMKGGPPSLRL